MVVSEITHAAQLRLANYYLARLKELNFTYQSGGENIYFALARFDQEWEQIQHWQAWSVVNAAQNENIRRLVSEFPRQGYNLLLNRLTAEECIHWLTVGIEASKSLLEYRFYIVDLVNLANMYSRNHDYQSAWDYAQEALTYAQNIADTSALSQIAMLLGSIERRRGNLEQAHHHYREGLANFLVNRDIMGIATSEYNLSSLTGMMGDYESAQHHLTQALPLYRKMGNLLLVSACLNNLGLICFYKGNFAQAKIHLTESLTITTTLNYRSGISQALTNLAVVSETEANYDQAYTYSKQSLALCQELGDDYGSAISLLQLGRIAYLENDLGIAEDYFHRGIALHEKIADRYGLVECLWNLANCLALHPDQTSAEDYYRRSLALAQEVKHQEGQVNNYYTLSLLYTRQQRYAEALQVLAAGLELALILQTPSTLLNILGAASYWCCFRGNYAFGARWYGVFQSHAATLAFTRYQLADLHEILASVLGETSLAHFLETGQKLTLAEAIDELAHYLKNE